MKNSSISSARAVVYHCKIKGIRNIVISPGSRNAPLTLGFTSDPFFQCFSIVDERSAGFFALGMAQQLREIVALVCTSGSAVLNYYPAVAEAYYSEIPLLVLSADRPLHKIDIGDGQTIKQNQVYGAHSVFNGALKEVDEKSAEKAAEIAYNDAQINTAINSALSQSRPVHLNIPFEEPLYKTLDVVEDLWNVESFVSQHEDSEIDKEYVASLWAKATRKLVIIGSMHPDVLSQKTIDYLAGDPSILVMTETTSNLVHPNFINSIDSLIAPLELKEDAEAYFKCLQPDLIISLGGMIVSKKIKKFLRKFPAKAHWHVGLNQANNTYFCLNNHFKISADDFFELTAIGNGHENSHYQARGLALKSKYLENLTAYLKQIPYSDFKVFSMLSQAIPEKYQLQLANSSTVRYAQLFQWLTRPNTFCNRGTSGIEGCTSTAVGASIGAEYPTVLICGDLSFLYDKNGLWNRYIRPDFRIIVLNNSGGGIFRILPGFDGSEVFETYFETPQNLEFKPLAQMHGFQYSLAEDAQNLEASLKTFFKDSKEPHILEIRTPRELNEKILRSYFDFLSSDISMKLIIP